MNALYPHVAGYVIGIGSNIDPEANVPRILDALLRHFGRLSMSRILRTQPVNMASAREFFNLAVLVETQIAPAALKDICNGIECALGRDRGDPSRALKDRVADLDILFTLGPREPLPALAQVDGVYFQPVVADIYGLLGLSVPARGVAGVTIRLGEVSAGEVPATIHRDGRTGQIVVVEQRP